MQIGKWFVFSLKCSFFRPGHLHSLRKFQDYTLFTMQIQKDAHFSMETVIASNELLALTMMKSYDTIQQNGTHKHTHARSLDNMIIMPCWNPVIHVPNDFHYISKCLLRHEHSSVCLDIVLNQQCLALFIFCLLLFEETPPRTQFIWSWKC